MREEQYGGQHGSRKGKGGREASLRSLSKDVSKMLGEENYVQLISKLQEHQDTIIGRGGNNESKTAIRKLYETVNTYAKDDSEDDNAQRVAAKIYAAVAHTASRRKDNVFKLAKMVADEYLIGFPGDLSVRIERYVMFLELLVSMVG